MKTRRRLKSRQPSRRLPAKKCITAAEARRRAARHVVNQMFKGAKVADGAAVRLSLYTCGNWKAAQVWVVYKNPGAPMELKSSEIVIVSKRTGRILYEGAAGDEG